MRQLWRGEEVERRKQIAVAMSGNVAMLIWLGKQHLKPHDRHEVTNIISLTPDQIDRLTPEALGRWRSGEDIGAILRDPASWMDGVPIN